MHTNILAKASQRFTELEAQMSRLPMNSSDGRTRSYATAGWQQWATSVLSLVKAVFGETSPHYVNLQKAYAVCRGYDYEVDALKGVFRSAKDDFDGGYLFSFEVAISGEIFGDFVALAKAALQDGSKDVAAVLASAALEDALKRFAIANGLDVQNKSMQDIVNALKSKGLVSGAQKSLLDTMPKLRDFAMHANWEKISPQDVGSILGFVEHFLLAHFS